MTTSCRFQTRLAAGCVALAVTVLLTTDARQVRADEIAASDSVPVAAKHASPPSPVFVSSDPSAHIVPPEMDPPVRINPEAPGPFVAMAVAHQKGDRDLAQRYAEQYVRYQMNLFFEVRELAAYIGEALIRQGVIEEDDWIGVGQLIQIQLAAARHERNELLKPTQERALERVIADPRGRVDVYYFFTLSCSYCREMAADVDRLWRAVKPDSRVRMRAFLLEQHGAAWLDEYRQYTGLTVPVENGSAVARAFKIGFVPAIVVVTPTNGAAYLKTGQQSFESMYELLRRAQGTDGHGLQRTKRGVESDPRPKSSRSQVSKKADVSRVVTAPSAVTRVAGFTRF